jgi:hypothetical protein
MTVGETVERKKKPRRKESDIPKKEIAPERPEKQRKR